MARIEHRFVRGISAKHEVQYEVRGPKGNLLHHTLPLTQSVISSECGILCTLMAAMILLGLPRPQVEALATTRRGSLKRLWAIAKAHYFEGASVEDIQRYIRAFSPELTSMPAIGSPAQIGRSVAVAIDDDAVSLLLIEARSWVHWTICIAVEIDADTERPLALLCIDPAAAAPWAMPFSARLELNSRLRSVNGKKSAHPLIYRYVMNGDRCAVRLLSAVIVSRAQPP